MCIRDSVREQGLDAYDFSHDKIRAVAYAEISPVRRCAMHLRVAEVIAMMYASDLDAQSIQIAEHYKQAGKPQLAISYFRRAAAAAQRIYANAAQTNAQLGTQTSIANMNGWTDFL